MRVVPMTRFLLIFAVVLAAQFATAGEELFYVADSGGGIMRGTIDAGTGRLEPLRLAAQAEAPGYLALSPDGRFLYATLGAQGGAVGAFRVESDGGLTPLNAQPSGGEGPCHLSVDATGRNVFVANYSGGNVACLRVGADGSLGERSALVQLHGTGPNAARQEAPHAHAVLADPTNRFVYVCDLGTDRVWIFAFDPAKGTLTPTQPDAGVVPPGAGPRHIALDATRPFAYVINELGLSVTAFARDAASGALAPIQTEPLMALDPSAGLTAAAIKIHPTGKWLVASIRGVNTLSVCAIGADGKLKLVQTAPAEVKAPRDFAIDPSGRWLIAAGQQDNRLAVLAIDVDTGMLAPTGESAEVGAPACVVFPGRD